MKVKVYPLTKINDEILLPSSVIESHLAIIFASFADGSSFLSNVSESHSVKVTIEWCKKLGAVIKESGHNLYIKGNRNTLVPQAGFLFDADDSLITAKLLIPLLSLVKRPVGITGKDKIISELLSYIPMIKECGGQASINDNCLRLDSAPSSFSKEFMGNTDPYLVFGWFIAANYAFENTTIKFKAPIFYQDDYSALVKMMKNFGVNVRKVNSVSYEFSKIQKYKHYNYNINYDPVFLTYLYLIYQKKNMKFNLKSRSSFNDINLLNNLKNNKLVSKTTGCFDGSIAYHALSFFCSYLSNSNSELGISYKEDNIRHLKQVPILETIYQKLGYGFNQSDNIISIKPAENNEVKQVSCGGDYDIAISLMFKAILGKTAIVIRDIEPVLNYNDNLIDAIKSLGAKVEYIHG